MDGHDPAAEDHWWYPGGGDQAAATDAYDNFIDMFGNSSEDLFKLVWEGGTAGQPAVYSIPSSPPPQELQRVSLEPPPSHDVMAAWLYPIVSGETDQAGDSTKVPAKEKREPELSTMATMTTDNKGKLPATVDISGAKVLGGSRRATRSSHDSGIHNSAEKRRRCKISDKLRILQQLVPGCDKSNQASTLEQTIQYMKSLQQQVQSMNMRPMASAAPATLMVPYGAMIPYAHYHSLIMPAAAPSALPVMMPAPATSAAQQRGRVLHLHEAAPPEAQEGEREE